MNSQYGDHRSSFAVLLLEGCAMLASIDLSGCGACITDKAAAAIGKYCHQMKSINLANNERVATAAMTSIARGCKSLESLDLSGNGIPFHSHQIVKGTLC